MTAESLLEHDASPSFVWDERYRRQLQELADTDEMTSDISWPSLKDAIKHILKQTLHQWPSSSSPILHPAAALIPLQTSASFDEASGSGTSLAGFANGNGSAATRNGIHGNEHQQEQQAGSATSSENAAQALENRFAAEGATAGDDDEIVTGHHDQDISVREADMQAFFPSKRQAPGEWKGSWGKRIDTEEELNRERRVVFGMLDDFENQPPFTIQRLAELVLQPTEHHHTVPKYISALKRLLSVTATRDAFPAHPGEEDEEDDELMSDLGAGAPANEAERINGAGPATPSSTASRSRRATPVPGSPTTAPLFSPIPFLMKSGDEGMPGAGPDASGGSDEASEQRFTSDDQQHSADLPMIDRDVPVMELGGADRTTEEAAEHARKTGKGAGSNKQSISDTVHEAENDAAATPTGGNASSSSSTSLSDMDIKVPQPVDIGVEPTQAAAGAGGASSSSAAAQPISGTNALSGTASEPLGVPSGPVDEMDQVGEKHGQLPPLGPGSVAGGARAFSSTTTTSGSQSTSDVSNSSADEERDVSTRSSSHTDSDSGRMLKRVRSERHLGGGGGGADA